MNYNKEVKADLMEGWVEDWDGTPADFFKDFGILDRLTNKFATKTLYNLIQRDMHTAEPAIQEVIDSRGLNMTVDEFVQEIVAGKTILEIVKANLNK